MWTVVEKEKESEPAAVERSEVMLAGGGSFYSGIIGEALWLESHTSEAKYCRPRISHMSQATDKSTQLFALIM